MKVTKSHPEVLKSDKPKDEWPRCKVCSKFLKSGQKSYCCNECRLEDIQRNAIINRQVKKAKLERKKERKTNRKRRAKEKEDREKHAERERKKTDTAIRRAKKTQKAKTQRPKKESKRRGVKPILDALICPNCGRPTLQEATKKKTIRKPPVMNTLTKWTDIRKDGQEAIIGYIATLISGGVISETDLFDFFKMMSDALLKTNRITVSDFILRHLTRMYIEHEMILAEDEQHTQEMPKDVREHHTVKWMRALVFAKARAHPERYVACPKCYKLHRWKGGQKETIEEDRDKELISTLKKGGGGGRQLWTHQNTDFGRPLRSNEETDMWVLCKRCEKEKALTPKDELRVTTYRELAEEAIFGKKAAPTGRTEKIVRGQLVKTDGAIVCGDCGHCFRFEKVYDFRTGKDPAETVKMESINDELRKGTCDVCRRKFYRSNGASGICEHCASKIYLENGFLYDPRDCNVFIFDYIGLVYMDGYDFLRPIDWLCDDYHRDHILIPPPHMKKSLVFTVGLPARRRGGRVPKEIDKSDLKSYKNIPAERTRRKSWVDDIYTSPFPPEAKRRPTHIGKRVEIKEFRKLPDFTRVDFPVGKFGSREIAEEYARERGGYCAGRGTTAHGEVWLVFVKRFGSREIAEEYARERGGYCTGKEITAHGEVWPVFVKKTPLYR